MTVVAPKKNPNGTFPASLMSANQKNRDEDIPELTPLLLVKGNLIKIGSLVDKKKVLPWGRWFIHFVEKWPFEFIQDDFGDSNCEVFSVTDADHTSDLFSDNSRNEASYGVLKNIKPLPYGTALTCSRGKDYYLFRSNFQMLDKNARVKCMKFHRLQPEEFIQDLPAGIY